MVVHLHCDVSRHRSYGLLHHTQWCDAWDIITWLPISLGFIFGGEKNEKIIKQKLFTKMYNH